MSKDYEIVHLDDLTTEDIVDEVSQTPQIEPIEPTISLPTAEAENVEYDIVVPGGGVETYQMSGPESVEPKPDAMLLAKRRLAQLKMVNMMLKRQKRLAMLEQHREAKERKSVGRRKLQKASRAANRKKKK